MSFRSASRPGRRRTVALLAAVVLVVAAIAAGVSYVLRPDPVHVRLVALNDFHGSLRPNNGEAGEVVRNDGSTISAGGAAFVAAHIARLRAAVPDTVVLSAGDNVGTSELSSALFHDEPTVDLLDQLDVAASVVGNHEFDEGLPELLRLQRGGCHPVDGCRFRPEFTGANFPFLGANVSTADGERPLPAYTVVETRGARIGVIGMTLRGMARLVPTDVLGGLRFEDEVEAVRRASEELTAQDVHAQVVLLHDGDKSAGGPDECGVEAGGAAAALARAASSQIDVIFTGHTHQQYVCSVPDPAGVPRPVVQGLSHGRLLSVVDLTLADGDVVRERTVVSNEIVTRDLPPDPLAESLVTEAVRLADPIARERVGTIAADLMRTPAASGESPLGAVLADAELAATRKSGAQVALVNPSGLRGDLRAGADGVVNYGEVRTMLPFGRTVQTLTMTGKQLEDVLEGQSTSRMLQVSSTLRYTWTVASPDGSRVSNLRIDGRPVDSASSYRVAADNFLVSGGNGFTGFGAGTDVAQGPTDVEAVLSYLAANPLVVPPTGLRITLVP